MIFLAPYVGAGTHADPFRPRGASDFPQWGAFDRRPDPTRPDGFALVWLPEEAARVGLEAIALDPSERLTSGQRTRIGNLLSKTFDADLTAGALLALLGNDKLLGGKVRPDRRGRRAIWIHGQQWWFEDVDVPVFDPFDPSDSFARGDESPIAGKWTTGFSGWGNLRLISQTLAGPSGADADSLAYRNDFTPHNDQFSQIELSSDGADDNDWGPACRIGTSAMDCYFVQQRDSPVERTTYKVAAGTFTQIETFGAAGADLVPGDRLRIEAEGSTIRHIVNGSETTGSPTTDTTHTSGRVGVFIFDSVARLDSWQGGDLAAPPAPSGFGGGGFAAWGEVEWGAVEEATSAAAVSFTGGASFSTTAYGRYAAQWSVAGAATFLAAGTRKAAGAWSVAGAATFAAAGTRKAVGAWAVVGEATFLAAGVRKAAGAIALEGAASFLADGTVVSPGGTTFQGEISFEGAASFALDGAVVSPPAPSPVVGGAPGGSGRWPHGRYEIEPFVRLERDAPKKKKRKKPEPAPVAALPAVPVAAPLETAPPAPGFQSPPAPPAPRRFRIRMEPVPDEPVTIRSLAPAPAAEPPVVLEGIEVELPPAFTVYDDDDDVVLALAMADTD